MSSIQPEHNPEVFAGIPVRAGEPFNPYAIAEVRIANEQALTVLQQTQIAQTQGFVDRALLSASLLRSPIGEDTDNKPQVVRVGNRIWGRWSFDQTFQPGQYDEGIGRYTQSLGFTAEDGSNSLRVYRMKVEDLSDGRTLGRLRITFNEFNQVQTIQLRWRVTKDHMAAYELMGIGSVPVGNGDLRAFLDLFGNEAIAGELRSGEMSWNTLTLNLGASPTVTLNQRFFSSIGFNNTVFDFTHPELVNLQSTFTYNEAQQEFVRHFGIGQERRHQRWANDRIHRLQKTMTPDQFMQGVRGLLGLVPQPNQESRAC